MKTKLNRVVVELALLFWLPITKANGTTNYTLTVSAQGSGIVPKNPANTTYPSGDVVTITATALPDDFLAAFRFGKLGKNSRAAWRRRNI